MIDSSGIGDVISMYMDAISIVRLLDILILRTMQSLLLKAPSDMAFLAKSIGTIRATLALSEE